MVNGFVAGSHQDIVPQPLIDHFVSMCDPVNAVSTDTDLPHHCAFSLPAVAYTLGPTHWDLLRDTYTTLASDKKVKDLYYARKDQVYTPITCTAQSLQVLPWPCMVEAVLQQRT